MNDVNDNQPQAQTPAEPSIPPQSSPLDTSNWDDRPFTTPGNRVVIETLQGSDSDTVIAE